MMQEYLSARPMLQERHRPNFSSLTHYEVIRTVVRLQQDLLLPRSAPYPIVATGDWLFDLCREAELDHAAVMFPLCREVDTIGVGALSKLLGHQLTVWKRPERTVPKPVVTSDGRVVPPRPAGTFSPDMVVLSVVASNPKKPGSSTWHRFAIWQPGRTVAECMRLGLTRADVLWDIDASRKFVVLGSAKQWADSQRAAEGGAA